MHPTKHIKEGDVLTDIFKVGTEVVFTEEAKKKLGSLADNEIHTIAKHCEYYERANGTKYLRVDIDDKNGNEFDVAWFEPISSPSEEVELPDHKKFVQDFMDGHEPDTFIKSKNPKLECWYTSECGRSALNLNYYMESLLDDYLELIKSQYQLTLKNKEK